MASGKAEPGSTSSEVGGNLATAEFVALRAEVLKFIELQFQLVGLTVVALGTILSVGYQTRNSAVISVFPILSLILAMYWLNIAHSIIRCATYIKEHIEPLMPLRYIGWEHYIRQIPIKRERIGYWGVRAIFLGGALVSVLAAISVSQWTFVETAALCVGIASTVATFALFFLWRERVPGLPGEVPAEATKRIGNNS